MTYLYTPSLNLQKALEISSILTELGYECDEPSSTMFMSHFNTHDEYIKTDIWQVAVKVFPEDFPMDFETCKARMAKVQSDIKFAVMWVN